MIQYGPSISDTENIFAKKSVIVVKNPVKGL